MFTALTELGLSDVHQHVSVSAVTHWQVIIVTTVIVLDGLFFSAPRNDIIVKFTPLQEQQKKHYVWKNLWRHVRVNLENNKMTVKTMFVTRLNTTAKKKTTNKHNAGLQTKMKTVALGGTGGNDKGGEWQQGNDERRKENGLKHCHAVSWNAAYEAKGLTETHFDIYLMT